MSRMATNDFMHAAGYLNTCCEKLGIAQLRSAA